MSLGINPEIIQFSRFAKVRISVLQILVSLKPKKRTSLVAENTSLPAILIERRLLLLITFILTGMFANIANAQWYNTSWTYRKAITIDYTKVGTGPHTNFPVLINITDNDLKLYAQAGGNDIVFTSANGTTKISHEIESYTSATGALVAWVEVPAMSSTVNTVLYMYYGNTAATNQQDVSGTWDASFRGVYHLNNAFLDATANNNDGVNTGTINATGKISNGRAFVRSNGDDYIRITGTMGSPANVTLSGWATLTSPDVTGAQLINIGDNVGIDCDDRALGTLGFSYFNNTWNRTTNGAHYAGTGWHYYSYTFDDAGNVQRFFIDGNQVASSAYTPSIYYPALGTDTYIGAHANGNTGFNFDGSIDEVRVASSVRSAGWIKTEYNNQNSPSTFYSVGSASCQTPAPTVTSPIAYCQNATAIALTATGSNLVWFTGAPVSGTAGGTAAITGNYGFLEGRNPPNTVLTSFTTTTANVTIVSVDYTISPYNSVAGLVLGLYNSANTLIATSSTNTTVTAGATPLKIANVFNYNLSTAGSYNIRAVAGYGNSIGYDNPTYPITEVTGTINVTGSGAGSRFFNNIQFTKGGSSTAPIPVTTTTGSITHSVTQTVNGCVSPSATITVNITATVGTPTAITVAAGTQPTCQLTNGTTTTTYATTAANNTGFTWSLSNPAAGVINSTTGVMTWANGFSGSVNIQVRANGCNGPSAQVTRTVTVTPTVGTPSTITIAAGTEPSCQITNTTTTTTYFTTSTNATSYNGSLSNPAAGTINMATGVIAWANGFSGSVNIQVTANGCNGPSAQTIRTVNITPTVSVPTFTLGAISSRCQAGGTVSYAATAANSTAISYSLDASSLLAGNSIIASTGMITFAVGYSGTSVITAVATGCNGPASATHTVTTNAATSVTATSTPTCVGGSTGSITAVASNGSAPYTYSLNAGTYQSSATFTGLNAGTYTVNASSSTGCIASTTVTVNPFAVATDDESFAGNNTWVGHVYDGINFSGYTGQYNEAETFNQTFGGSTTCFGVTSNSLARSIYTETFSVKYRMNSTRKGLYVVDIGSDDGSRLTVDGTLVYNSWSAQSFIIKSSVLLSFNGASSLLYEYYENSGGNQVAFQNLSLVLANTLSANATQSICLGSTGSAISGDTYGALPAGVTLSGTGYQWSYSTTPGGPRVNITGATGATFTPSSSAAPFNAAGTYYLYRNANVASANNVSPNPYVASNESNAAIVTVTSPSATISYPTTPYCSSEGSATVNLNGTVGGTFTGTAGLSINPATGAVNLSASTAGSHTVTYTIAAAGGCPAFTTTTNITITTQPFATGFYAGNPYCTNAGTAYPSGSSSGAPGTLSITGGILINSSNGGVTLNSAAPGTYTVTYTVPPSGGCSIYTTSYDIIIKASPTATISYGGSPYCSNSTSTATVTHSGTTGGVYSSTTGLSINASTGTVNLTASTPGTYTVTYKIAAATSCAAFTTTTTITVQAVGTWTGNVSTDWHNAANWGCNTIPTATTDVRIPVRPNLPVITSTTAAVKNLTINSGATITNNAALQIAGTITNSGSIHALNGTVEMNGAIAQVIPAGVFNTNILKNLVISNTAGVTLAGVLRISDRVSFGSVNNSVFSTGGFLTLGSTLTRTAEIGDLTNNNVNAGNTITGEVTVERYLTARRSFRFLSAPVNTSGSIRANWMENSNNASTAVNNNPVPGYGIHITGAGGSANGFDATGTNNPSLYSFNNLSQTWSSATNTNGLLKAGTPYRIMVRGNRSTDLSTNFATPSVTTVRAKGTLTSGPVVFAKAGAGTAGMPELSSTPNAYNLIANPFAAAVDWKKLDKNDVASTIYYYDPTIEGSNGRGSYVSYNDLLGAVSNGSSNLDHNIQSGQGFFVQTIGVNPSITFKEADKVSTQKSIFRPASSLPHLDVKLLLPRQENTNMAADGFVAYFSNDFESAIGNDDSYKFTNVDENIAILRNEKALSIEGRKPPTTGDTLPIKLWQLTQTRYSLNIGVANFNYNVVPYLEDAYLKVRTVLNNDAETNVPFAIDDNPASAASNRFHIVFESFATLPVQLTGITATEKNKGVLVEWIAQSETNMSEYEVQKSNNALNFATAVTIKAKGNSGTAYNYDWFDENPFDGDNYYRIKSVDHSGEIKYSQVVRVVVKNNAGENEITAFPTSTNDIKVSFENVKKGTYKISIINNIGQTVHTESYNHTGGSSSKTISIKREVAAGIYQIHIVSGDVRKTIKVLID